VAKSIEKMIEREAAAFAVAESATNARVIHEIERKTSPRPQRRHFCKRWRAAVGIFPSPCNLYVRQLSNCECVEKKSKPGEHGQCPAVSSQPAGRPTGKSEKHLSQLLSVLEPE
jgi:hypothetical protein